MTDPALVVEVTRAIATTTASPYAPVIAPELFNVPTEEDAEQLTAVFMQAQGHAALGRPDTEAEIDHATLSVLLKLTDWIPKLGLAPSTIQDEHTLEWHWAKVRCIFAGPGFLYHAPLARACQVMYPQCPLDPEETYDQWYGAAIKARNSCGWPLTFSVTPFAGIAYSLSEVDTSTTPIAKWQQVFAVLHLLKHLRRSPLYGPVVLYRGSFIALPPADRGNLLIGRADVPLATQAMGFIGNMGLSKQKHPLTAAILPVLQSITAAQVLSRSPTALLPAQVLHGQWSTYAQDPAANTGFIQHGLTLDGVYIASRGKVVDARDADPSTDDIVGQDWNMQPRVEDLIRVRGEFERALVRTYKQKQWPSEVLADTIPNLVWKHKHHEDLFNALLVAGVMRAEVPALEREMPILVILPEHPTPDDSTKQGKSACGHAIMRSMVLDIPLKIASRNSSAPDQRSMADGIVRRGTIYLDEWQLDTNPAAFLSKDNLQTMTTGGCANAGRVMENDEINVPLRQFMTVSAKALNVPPDIVNRLFVLFLDNLTNAQFADGPKYDDAVSGRLSIRLRLAAISKAEQYGFAGSLNKAKMSGTSTGTRFLRHRHLAALIIKARTDHTFDEAMLHADLAMRAMAEAQAAHTTAADANGLLSMMEANIVSKMRVSVLFSDLDGQQATMFQTYLGMISKGLKAGATAGQVLRARAEVAHMGNRPIADLFRYLVGPGPFARMSDRALSLAMAKELTHAMPEPGAAYAFPDLAGLMGWVVERQENYQGTPMYKLVNRLPTHSTNSIKTPLEGAPT